MGTGAHQRDQLSTLECQSETVAPSVPCRKGSNDDTVSIARIGNGRAQAANPSITTKNLEFLRGAAAFYVLIGHTRGHLFAGGRYLSAERDLGLFDYAMLALLQLTSMGTEAVILFFVLSGYAMAHSMTHSRSVVSFYLKRFLRIFPPYLAAVAIAFAIAYYVILAGVSGHIGDQILNDRWDLPAFILMISYLKVNTVLTAQFWSLPHEIMFYVLCPLLLIGKKRVVICAALALVVSILCLSLFGIYDLPTNAKSFPIRQFGALLIFFMVGALAYHFKEWLPKMRARVLLWTAPAYFCLLWYTKFSLMGGWNAITSLLTIPLAIILITSVPAKVSQNRWLNWGHFSYSLYIVHMQFILLIAVILEHRFGVTQSDMTSYWMWILAIPPVLAASWVFYALVEKQSDRVLSSIRNSEQRR